MLNKESWDEAIMAAARVIRDGGVTMIPTDTCYGLAADTNNPAALKKLFSIKGRSDDKKVSSIYPSVENIANKFKLSPWQRSVLEKNLPGPFTFIISGESVRIPAYHFTQALAALLQSPFTATSANRSGADPLYSASDAEKEFGAALPDIIIDAGDLEKNPPSTVVDISTDIAKILRHGERLPTIDTPPHNAV